MSLFSRNKVVLSAGMSCQSAKQIELNAEQIRRTLNAPDMEVSRGLYDWTICRPKDLARIVRSGFDFPKRSELSLQARPYWAARKIFFWHDFWEPGVGPDIGKFYDQTRQKYAYLARKFDDVRQADDIYIVGSNCQNTLELMNERSGGLIRSVVSIDDLEQLRDAFDHQLGKPCHMLFVTNPGRFIGARRSERIWVFQHQPDESEWVGDEEQWRRSFDLFFREAGQSS
jgi:hypothetical protein